MNRERLVENKWDKAVNKKTGYRRFLFFVICYLLAAHSYLHWTVFL
jgi:hypothetical protein